MDATDLLKKMADLYSSARTYTDRGIVSTTFVRPDRREVGRRSFVTAFERPYRFRYDFSDEIVGHRLSIRQHVPPAKLSWTVRGEVQTLALSEAISRATGVSGGSALTIPRLLLPNVIESQPLTDIADPVNEGLQVVQGVSCARVVGQGDDGPIVICIGVEDLLVRRIFAARHFGQKDFEEALANVSEDQRRIVEEGGFFSQGEFDTEMETLYTPRRDVELDSTEFGAEGDRPEAEVKGPGKRDLTAER